MDQKTAPETGAPGPGDRAPMAVMTVDVEDWFHVENLKSVIPRDSWSAQESRVERNTDRVLAMMDGQGVRGTFFILGWVADRFPGLVQRIAGQGHEIASHGFGHDLVYALDPDGFRRDVGRSVQVLEDLTGEKVRGYRAPSFSITEWALDVLRELGLEYDSSSFPAFAHDRYGRIRGTRSDWPLSEVRPGLTEVSISCVRMAGRSLPWGGGGYFRLIPYPVFKRGIERILGAGTPYIFYIHPWEIDDDQPRVSGLPPLHHFRHYNNLKRGAPRLESLLADFSWSRAWDLVAAHGQAASAP